MKKSNNSGAKKLGFFALAREQIKNKKRTTMIVITIQDLENKEKKYAYFVVIKILF